MADDEERRMESYREQIIALVKAGQSRHAQELCRAQGVRIDLIGADLRWANLIGARYSSVTKWSEGFDPITVWICGAYPDNILDPDALNEPKHVEMVMAILGAVSGGAGGAG